MTQCTGADSEVRVTTLQLRVWRAGRARDTVTRILDGMTGVVHISVDLRKNEAVVEHLPAYVDAAGLVAAIRGRGTNRGLPEQPLMPSDCSPRHLHVAIAAAAATRQGRSSLIDSRRQ
jgi:hypothetical protein